MPSPLIPVAKGHQVRF